MEGNYLLSKFSFYLYKILYYPFQKIKIKILIPHFFVIQLLLYFFLIMSAFPHFWELDNSSIIAKQNVKAALACQPVLQYKKPRCGG